jgi:hypothetical protein
MKRSTPSSTPKSPTKPGGSTTSWTIPQPTDVLSYAYLWAREAEAGREEAAKDRPVVVVLAVTARGGLTEVIVAPVTTQPPRPKDDAVEMPVAVKTHLGLEDRRCWIVTGELNRFNWPGPDIRPIPAREHRSPFYGKIPGKLLERVRGAMRAHVAAGRMRVTKRSG